MQLVKASDPRAWVLVAAAAIGALEIGLRAVGYGHFVLTTASARYGWRMPANASYTDPPTNVPVRTNSRGFRDDEWPARDAGLLRVAFVGNSVTWGGGGLAVGERFDRAFARLAQTDLDRSGDPRRVVPMNFALPGFALEQMARIYEDEVRPLAPDVLVFPVIASDVRPMRPMADGPATALGRWVQTSAIRDVAQRHLLGGWGATVSDEQRAVEAAVRADPFAAEHDGLWEASLRRLGEVHALAASEGTRLVVLALPLLDDVLGDGPSRTAARLEPWCAERGLLLVDPLAELREAMAALAQELRERGLERDEVWGRDRSTDRIAELRHSDRSAFFFHDADHPTELGHAAIGRALHAALARAGLLAKEGGR